MSTNPKFEPVPLRPREKDLSADPFHEDRVQQDLAKFANAPGIVEKCFERVRIRFRKAGEQAVLQHWTNLYQAGERLVAARTAMERQKSEYVQLAREHEVKEMEKSASLAKLHADIEESDLRTDKASYQRQHVDRFVDGAESTVVGENEQKLNEANKRRQLDVRWELHESLHPLRTLIELQHWRRQQRDGILKDRSLNPEEQSEDLRFVDELYQTKHAELKVDTRIFEDS